MNQIKLTSQKTEKALLRWHRSSDFRLFVCPNSGRTEGHEPFLRNCILLAPPHTEGSLHLNRLKGELYGIEFPGELLPGELTGEALSAPMLLPDAQDAFMAYILAAYHLLESGTAWEGLTRQTVQNLLSWFARQPLFTEGERPSHATQLVEQAKQIIREEYASDLTLQQIAQRLYVNPCYLSTVFHAQTGETFRDYLKTVRLQHARRHLLESNRQITDIAMLSGFNSTAYLIRSFREKYGLTPSVFRARHSTSAGKQRSGFSG